MSASLSIALLLTVAAPPATTSPAGFRVVTLGAQGGLVDGDLSAYLLKRAGHKALLLDAGTLVHGIDVARAKGALTGDTLSVLKDIAAVLVSHAHFDHTAGLVIGSPDDVARPLLALSSTIDALRDHVFNGVTWANFGDEGAGALKRYHYLRMQPGAPVHIDDAAVDVTAYALSHAGTTSTAFVVQASDADDAVVYCGDTGADDVEKSDDLAVLWQHVAPLARGHTLRAIFLEASYPSARDDGKLFGHLTPKHVMAALHTLARDVDLQHPERALAGVTVIVTHMKPALNGDKPRDAIIAELTKANDLGVRFVFPQQGDVVALGP